MAEHELAAALVSAYRPYVTAMLAERGLGPVAGLEPSLVDGEAWLGRELATLLSRPFAEQTRGPLEVFQEAMEFPTRALAAAGVAAVTRDEVTANALPGDLYDLAPASSRDLGEEVWAAHLRWGVEKAAALRHR
ncbi:MAG: hypothetical protein WD532_11755 [Acidimicrobiia bacterium]